MLVVDGLTRNELADALKVDRKTLNDWERKDSAPVAKWLELPIAEAVAAATEWRQANKRPRYWSEADADADGTLQERLIAAQTRKANADADAKELKNRKERGLLVDQEDAAQQVAEILTVLNARLEQIPDELRKELPAEHREFGASRVGELIYLALKECAAKLRSVTDDPTA